MRLHGSYIGQFINETSDTLRLDITNQIVVVTPINISIQIDAVVQETQIQTDIELMLLLVGQLRIGNIAQYDNCLHLICLRTPSIRRIVDRQSVRHIRRSTIGCQRI